MANRIENPSDDFETVPVKEWVMFEVPAENIMGGPFPTIRINGHEFAAGRKHEAPPAYATHVAEIIATQNRNAVRLLSPKKDLLSLRQANSNPAIKPEA